MTVLDEKEIIKDLVEIEIVSTDEKALGRIAGSEQIQARHDLLVDHFCCHQSAFQDIPEAWLLVHLELCGKGRPPKIHLEQRDLLAVHCQEHGEL